MLDVSQPVDQRYNPSGRKQKSYNRGESWARHAAYIESQATDSPLPLVQAVFHAPVQPEDQLEWRTPGGQQVRLQVLEPARVDVETLDEAGLFGGGVSQKECGNQIRVSPTGFIGGKLTMSFALQVGEAVPVGLEGDQVKVGGKTVRFEPDGITVQ